MAYPDMGVDSFDDGMDTGHSSHANKHPLAAAGGMRGLPSRSLDYLDNLPTTEMDTGMGDQMDTTSSQSLGNAVGGDILAMNSDLAWV